MTLLDQNIQLREFVPVAPAVNITPAAAERLLAMMAERDISDYALRVFVSGGGCSGMQYGMTFDNEARDGDARDDMTRHPTRARWRHQQRRFAKRAGKPLARLGGGLLERFGAGTRHPD